MDNQNQKLEQETKTALSVVHLFLGKSILVKGAIVATALAAGYGSVVYYKASNPVSEVAETVIKEETGIPMHFMDNVPS